MQNVVSKEIPGGLEPGGQLSQLSAPTSHAEERVTYAAFASQSAEEDYRMRLAELYALWRDYNKRFFDCQMKEPHLVLGRTAPRSLGHCQKTTDYGGEIQIGLNAALVFGTNRQWVLKPWPSAEGTGRFIADVLLRFTVQQLVLEVHHTAERGYRGFGSLFVEEANRIGMKEGIAPVVERRRGWEDERPVASGWPHCVRPLRYYGDDVTERLVELASRPVMRQARVTVVPSQGMLELIHFLLNSGRSAEAQGLIARHLDWMRAYGEGRMRPCRRLETGLEDIDGSPLREVSINADWLRWNDGTVKRIAQAVMQEGSFADLPILGDALEEAGCNDGRILRHLRAKMSHSRRCWALRLLLALEAE